MSDDTKPYRLKGPRAQLGVQPGGIVYLTASQAKAFADRIEDPQAALDAAAAVPVPVNKGKTPPPAKAVPAPETTDMKTTALSHAAVQADKSKAK